MTYQQDTARLADTARAQVAALYAAYLVGRLDVDQFKTASVQVMLTLMGAAATLADLALAKYLKQPPVGTPAVDAADRLGKALDTVLTNPNSDMAIQRLAGSETLAAAQAGWGSALQKQPGVTGWTRGTRPGACDLCQRLAGSVLSMATPMYHHPACNCVQKPVLSNQQFS